MKSSINTEREGRYLDDWTLLLIVVIILGKIIDGRRPVIAKVVKVSWGRLQPLEGTNLNPKDLNGQERSICLCHHNHSTHETFAAEIWHSSFGNSPQQQSFYCQPKRCQRLNHKKIFHEHCHCPTIFAKKMGCCWLSKIQHFYSTFPSFPWRLPRSPPLPPPPAIALPGVARATRDARKMARQWQTRRGAEPMASPRQWKIRKFRETIKTCCAAGNVEATTPDNSNNWFLVITLHEWRPKRAIVFLGSPRSLPYWFHLLTTN